MSDLYLGSCAIALVLMITQRRDLRLVARLPLLGATLIAGVLISYAAGRVILRPVAVGRADGAFVRAVLAAGSGFAMPLAVAWLRALLRQDLPRLIRAVGGPPRWTASYVLLGLLFAVVYFLYGRQLGLRGVFEQHDMLFDADPLYEQHACGGAIHTHTHPLLPLIWYVGCRTMALLVDPRWAPLALNSAFGAMCVFLAGLYFRTVTGSGGLGLLGALVLASTSAHLVFAAMPESWVLSAGTLIVLQLLVAGRDSRALRRRHVVLACVLASGVTITNALPALVCFLLWQPRRRVWAERTRWLAGCLVMGSFLFGLQMVVRPKAEPLQPEHYVHETRFLESAVPLPQRIAGLAHGLFVQGVVGWTPAVGIVYGRPVLRASSTYDTLGLVTAGVWIGLCMTAAWVLLRWGLWRRRSFAAVLACLVAAGGLYSFYGLGNLFLYSCSFTFYVLAILAHSLAGRGLRVAAVLSAFWLLLAFTNGRFGARIVAMLDQLASCSG